MPTLIVVGSITALRVLLLALNRTDLFVDEAQYWLWGRELAFGYYSKPPMIAWVIRASTALGGSDAAFWVRLPAPLLHGATALIIGAIAAPLFGRSAAIASALAYVTLPMVAVGSLLISTDTVMLPFLAGALLFWLRCLPFGPGATGAPDAVGKGGDNPATSDPVAHDAASPDADARLLPAIAAGVCLGLACLGKYAALYVVPCAALAALTVPAAMPRSRDVILALLTLVAVMAPNLLWNATNGFATIQHTIDNADWIRDPAARAGLNLSGLATYAASQFGVFGPVLATALVLCGLNWRRADTPPVRRVLLCFSLPILAVVCGQAVLSKAYANWGAVAYLAGTLVAVPWLLARARRWLALSFAINGALCLALALATVFADRLSLNGKPVLARYLGRHALSEQIIAAVKDKGLDRIVAESRDLLADLYYTGRDSGLVFRAVPADGRPPNHYAQAYPFTGENGLPAAMATLDATPPACIPAALPFATIAPGPGAWSGRSIYLFEVPSDCWARQ